MKQAFKIILTFLFAIAVVIASTFVYKQFDWNRIDILNIATLTTSCIAIVALFFNSAQYLLNKEKLIHERGEFRIKNYYDNKISRIHELKFSIIINEKVPNKGRGFEMNPITIHFLQHKLIEYLINNYGHEVPITEVYLTNKVQKTPISLELLNVLLTFHNNISNYSPWIDKYHRDYIDLIAEIKNDKKLSIDQKEAFISKIIQKNLLGYNLIINEKQTNNFKLIKHFDEKKWEYEPIGYLDLIKPLLPDKGYYLKSLGGFKYIMEEQLP